MLVLNLMIRLNLLQQTLERQLVFDEIEIVVSGCGADADDVA